MSSPIFVNDPPPPLLGSGIGAHPVEVFYLSFERKQYPWPYYLITLTQTTPFKAIKNVYEWCLSFISFLIFQCHDFVVCFHSLSLWLFIHLSFLRTVSNWGPYKLVLVINSKIKGGGGGGGRDFEDEETLVFSSTCCLISKVYIFVIVDNSRQLTRIWMQIAIGECLCFVCGYQWRWWQRWRLFCASEVVIWRTFLRFCVACW